MDSLTSQCAMDRPEQVLSSWPVQHELQAMTLHIRKAYGPIRDICRYHLKARRAAQGVRARRGAAGEIERER
jgi:hypothetical protein